MKFYNKNVLICGMAKSGIYAALMLEKLGANVTLQDLKSKENIQQIGLLKNSKINLYLGKNPDSSLIDSVDLMVISPGLPTDLDFIQYANKKIPVISEIELSYLVCKAPIIAITGTNGKTTTTSLLGHILNKYNKTYIVGNIGIPFSKYVLDIKKEDIVVLEISSFQLETIKNFKPKIATILNITDDHLDRHKTMENYIYIKEKIFQNQDEEDFLILNYDDLQCRKMKQKTKSKILYFSIREVIENGAYLKDNYIYINNYPFINIKDINILGEHNIQNVMSAILISLCYKVPKNIIIECITTFKAVEHRIEYVATKKGVDYYNDSKATNTYATIKAIKAMKKPTYIIVGGYDKGANFLPMIKEFKDKVVEVIVIGQAKEKLVKDFKKLNYKNYIIKETLFDAINYCYENAKIGHCVLLSPACASFDMFKDYEERGNIFKCYVKDLKE